MTRVVGSKWTSMQETMGWRHFRVIQCRKGAGASGVAFVQMQASCDPATQLWINAGNLKDRDLWAAGWLQMSEVTDPAGALAGGVTCRACSGTGSTPCPVCDATGAVMLPPSGLGGPAEARATAAASTSGGGSGGDGDAGGGGGDGGDGPMGHAMGGRALVGGGDAAAAVGAAVAVVGGGGAEGDGGVGLASGRGSGR